MSMEQIEHVVVLMLENRSFDSLLGWLYERDAPAVNIPSAAPGDQFRGLQGVDLDKFTNTALNGTLSAKPTRGVEGFTVPDYDPGEEFDHVNTQFYGTPTPGHNDPITMTGVLADFVQVLQKQISSDADVRRIAPRSMQSFTPGQLPVLNQLARHYAVSDDWFASVPSQTNPNRAFLMCGTSNGMVNNGDLEDNRLAAGLEKVLGMKIGDDRVDAPTIFNALNDAGIDWTVFWQTSYLPQKISTLLTGLPILIPLLTARYGPIVAGVTTVALALLSPFAFYLNELSSGDLTSCYTWRLFPQIQSKIPNAAQHFQKLEDFHRLARSGQLPKFSYVEPFWSISHNSNPKLAQLVTALGNDYHPPCNILVGEEFVKEVYTSLIANREAWCKTLLVITFDEFVGAFDHVTDRLKPGVVTPPWGKDGQPPFKSLTNFEFNRLGARIPTILVSPYVQKSTVFRSTTNVPYDHTSVIATTLKWLGQSDRTSTFGARTMDAPTFEQVLTLNQPRTDEKDLSFLDTPRQIGDPVHYGDSFVLKNKNGQYLSAFYRTMKDAGGGSVIPASVMGICVDLGIAADFPRLADGQPAVLSFVTQDPDPAAQINHYSQVMLVSREPGLSALNILGAWADSHDCYYADEYLDGDNATKEKWIVQKLANTDLPLRYGDQLYLVNSFFQGQRLTRDTRLFQSQWITTGEGGDCDYWTVEPAPARVHKFADPAGQLSSFILNDNPHVYYIGVDSHVHELGWDGQKWWHGDLNTEATRSPVDAVADSALTGCALSGTSPRMYYIGTDRHVHELGSDGQNWWHGDLSTEAKGYPPVDAAADSALTSFALSGTSPRVYYIGTDGHVHELGWDGQDWLYTDVTAVAENNPVEAVAYTALTSFALSGTWPCVFYIGVGGDVHLLWSDGQKWVHVDQTSKAKENRVDAVAYSALTSYVLSGTLPNTYHVYYIGTDGHVHELWWGNGFWHNDLNTKADGSPIDAAANSGLTSFAWNSTTTRVYYIGVDDHVHELGWNDGAWLHTDVTAMAKGNPVNAAAGSTLTSFAWSSTTTRVYYVGVDSHVHELGWNSGDWLDTDVTAMVSGS